MTYANDMIALRKSGLKRIVDHSNAELNAAINEAVRKHGDDFWVLLHGIDAYMERRRRRSIRPLARFVEHADPWGNS